MTPVARTAARPAFMCQKTVIYYLVRKPGVRSGIWFELTVAMDSKVKYRLVNDSEGKLKATYRTRGLRGRVSIG